MEGVMFYGVCQGGVVVAVDSRITHQTDDEPPITILDNDDAEKFCEIDEGLLVVCAGKVFTSDAILAELKQELKRFPLLEEKRQKFIEVVQYTLKSYVWQQSLIIKKHEPGIEAEELIERSKREVQAAVMLAGCSWDNVWDEYESFLILVTPDRVVTGELRQAAGSGDEWLEDLINTWNIDWNIEHATQSTLQGMVTAVSNDPHCGGLIRLFRIRPNEFYGAIDCQLYSPPALLHEGAVVQQPDGLIDYHRVD